MPHVGDVVEGRDKGPTGNRRERWQRNLAIELLGKRRKKTAMVSQGHLIRRLKKNMKVSVTDVKINSDDSDNCDF